MDILMDIIRILVIGLGTGLLGIPFEAGKEDLPINALLGSITFGTYFYINQLTHKVILATFIGTLVLSFLATYLTRKTKKPLQIYLVTAIIPLVPGYNLFKMVQSFLGGEYGDALLNMTLMIQLLSVIVLSTVIASSFTKMLKYLKINIR